MKNLLFLLVLSLAAFFSNAADSTSVTVNVGSSSFKSAPIIVTDPVTGYAYAATISNISITNANPSIATVSNPSSTTIRVTGLSAGTGYATVTCTASYVDPGDGLSKTEQKSIVIQYTVVGTPHGAKLSLTFN